jgi:superfamily II DNA/RNA helicase
MIIFVRSVRNAEDLKNKLTDEKIPTNIVHSKIDIIDRENILREFRLNYVKILISTDIMCRGIDIDDLRLVINYDMPDKLETYIHRVGRSGRFGGQGVAINFCTYGDNYKINTLNRDYSANIVAMPDPEDINNILTGIKPVVDKVKSSNNYI